ncbi:MAG: ubiquitin-like domain-containing protein [Anaerolineales bacterium]
MKFTRRLALLLAFFLFACQPATHPIVTIIDQGVSVTVQTEERVPAAILAQAGITLTSEDRLLSNGLPISTDTPSTDYPLTIQLRRAVNITISSPDGNKQIQTSAFTVGEALQDAGIQLRASDKVDPSLNTPITSSLLTIYYSPSNTLTVSVDGNSLQIQSSARTVGEALAEAGIPLLGLDYSLPAENEPLPSDGQIKVVRVSESVILAQKPIPYESELIASADVPLDQTQILNPGANGLSVQRIRVRYENGEEVARVTEEETLVRPPEKRVLAYGTKIEIKTATVDGVQIEYWRAVQMYATAYSPCNSGVANCGATTASGKHLTNGMVGLRLSWYLSMRGQQLYIPGYGYGSVEDVCGGCVGKPWIDLGYSDADYKGWSSWVTVYFLTPVPPTILYTLE